MDAYLKFVVWNHEFCILVKCRIRGMMVVDVDVELLRTYLANSSLRTTSRTMSNMNDGLVWRKFSSVYVFKALGFLSWNFMALRSIFMD